MGNREGKAEPKGWVGLDPGAFIAGPGWQLTHRCSHLLLLLADFVGTTMPEAGLRLGLYGAPHTTNGFMLIVTPAPSGPVTMASDCHVDSLSGNDELRTTYWFAAALEADT